MNTRTYLSRSLSKELKNAQLGDERLTNRLGKIVDAVSSRPSDGFPGAVGTTAALEGLYRFLRNEKVESDKILAPHFEETVKRCVESRDVLIISDTSIFCFALDPNDPSTKREGLGVINKCKQGFSGHFSLAVSAEEAIPLGILGLHTFIRTGKKGRRSSFENRNDPTRESLRWLNGVRETEERLPDEVNAIHIADREADFYELLNYFVENKKKCIIRVAHDRRLHEDEEVKMMYDKLVALESVYEREVPLSKRRVSRLRIGRKNANPPRGYRTAKLSFSACAVEIMCSAHLKQVCRSSLKLNLVHVEEVDCPKDEEPVDWKIITTEPISSSAEIVKIVDNYRKRWTIEEYFKALKSGCLYEERQLESLETLLNALAVFIPVAWKLLLMRTLARTEPDKSAVYVLTPTQIKVIKACSERKVGEIKTVKDALYAVAGMGGHIPNNGPPGWKVIGRGYQKVLLLERGWLAREKKM